MSDARRRMARVIRNYRRYRRYDATWERGYIMGYALAVASSDHDTDTYIQVRRIVNTYF